jgi:hypothetical protein
MPPPLFYVRGAVYLVKFVGFEKQEEILKFSVCLQQGDIVEKRRRFVGILTTSCKDNSQPKLFPWTVYISPDESKSHFGVIANCGEIHTFLTSEVVDGPKYYICEETMKKIDDALQFGVGWSNVEDLKKKLHADKKSS